MTDLDATLDRDEKFVCEICGKVFTNRYEYKQHNCDRHMEGGCSMKWD
jgi:uncharacterized C2H2 Zn-finger protein